MYDLLIKHVRIIDGTSAPWFPGWVAVNDGRIVERGTHDQLLALGGYYKRLNDMQQL